MLAARTSPASGRCLVSCSLHVVSLRSFGYAYGQVSEQADQTYWTALRLALSKVRAASIALTTVLFHVLVALPSEDLLQRSALV